jgi:hypothetical protein
MKYYTQFAHRRAKDHWNDIRDYIDDQDAKDFVDGIIKNNSISWNQFASWMMVLEAYSLKTPFEIEQNRDSNE